MRKIFIYILLNLAFFTAFSSKVEIKTTENGFQLLKDGKPYYINGAGGTVELEKLKNYGGNSIRTWGTSAETDAILAEAHKYGITVTFGIWMGQERQGFDYANEGAVKAQVEEFRRVVKKYKDHPAILMWGVGNEMDLDYTNFDVWKYLEELVKMIHEEDPNHPTMAVTAGLDVAEIKLINKHTPSLDILGVNTYGDISYLPEAIKVYGWNKPYVVAEWGPYGWWEVEKTEWGASIEQNSTEKAETYETSMKAITSDSLNCLGSYVFLWGQKQEYTNTWYGLFNENKNISKTIDFVKEFDNSSLLLIGEFVTQSHKDEIIKNIEFISILLAQNKKLLMLKFQTLDSSFIDDILEITYFLNHTTSQSQQKKYLESMFKMSDYHCLGVFLDNELIGVSSVWITVRLYSGKQAEIDNFIIHPEHQGHSSGKQFLDFLEDWAKKENCESLELNTYSQNRRSHTFYHRQGYEIFGFHFIKRFD